MILLFNIIAILLVSFVFVFLARKVHFSEVIGLIAAGLFLSLPGIKDFFITSNEEFIVGLSHIGLFALMLISGFEISRGMMKKESDDSLILTFITIVISLILGFGIFKLLGFSVATSLIMGICFSITAEATKARSLLQLHEIKTRIGALLLEAGILNDVFGVVALTLVIYYYSAGNVSFQEIWIIGGMIFFFFIGMLIHIYLDRESKKVKILENILLHTVVPFFFINMALHFSAVSVTFNFGLFLIVFLTSSFSQIVGAFISKFFIELNTKQAFLVGVAMNSKGAVELAVAFVAFKIGLLPLNLYSALVATSLVSTVFFHLVAYAIMAKNPKIMN